MDEAMPAAGAVYVLARDGGSWSQQAYVKASSPDADDWFGWSVALSADGDALAVGAYLEDGGATGLSSYVADDEAAWAGAVYVLARDDAGAWAQRSYVKASNTEASDLFGHAVALSADGNTLAVGARSEDGDATGIGGDPQSDARPEAGAVYLY
jgi:hypothetical protein